MTLQKQLAELLNLMEDRFYRNGELLHFAEKQLRDLQCDGMLNLPPTHSGLPLKMTWWRPDDSREQRYIYGSGESVDEQEARVKAATSALRQVK